MSLQANLDAFKAQFQSGKPPYEGVPREARSVMDRATKDLIHSGIADRAIKVGAKAPAFTLPDQDGHPSSLQDWLRKGPVVLSFYRGVWCPYCNIELKALEEAAAEIKRAGGTLVAVTPTTAANSRKAIADNKLSFPILTDAGNKVAESYGLRFRLADDLIDVYKSLGVNLPSFNGDESWTLPMPARLVIDGSGTVRYAEVSPDYTKRPEPASVLPILREATAKAA